MTPTSRSGTAGVGVVLYLIGVGLFSINDALGKWLVVDYAVHQDRPLVFIQNIRLLR